MTFWAYLFIMAVLAYGNRKPKRVIRYQPLEVPLERRRPSPWLPVEPPEPPRPAPIARPVMVKAQPAPIIAPRPDPVRADTIKALRSLGFSTKSAEAEIAGASSLACAIAVSLRQGARA